MHFFFLFCFLFFSIFADCVTLMSTSLYNLNMSMYVDYSGFQWNIARRVISVPNSPKIRIDARLRTNLLRGIF